MQIRPRSQLKRLACAAALATCGCVAQAEPRLTFQHSFVWDAPDSWFGGWSGIEILDAGARMVVISDRGRILQAELTRDAGTLRAVTAKTSVPITAANGGALPKNARDSEGLAIDGNGRVFVSFEHDHRIGPVDPDTGQITGRIALPFSANLAMNGGVEALAVATDGALFTIAETLPAANGPLLLYVYRADEWQLAAELPARQPFLPVGADIDAQGRFWLLERALTPLGFRSRVRRFDLHTGTPREEILLTTPPGQFDNLEGISVWNGSDGRARITMISDNNFLRIQRNQIVEYVLED